MVYPTGAAKRRAGGHAEEGDRIRRLELLRESMRQRLRHSVLVGFLVAAPVPIALVAAFVAAAMSMIGGPAAGGLVTPPAQAAAAPRAAQTFTVGWAGDITPGSRYGTVAGSGRSLLADVRGVVREADLSLGNLEGTLGVGGTGKCGAAEGNGRCFSFQAPPAMSSVLDWAGFDVMSVANNHGFDFGADGRRQTLQSLQGAAVGSTGQRDQITVVERRGVKVAVLGFAPYPWASDLLDPVGAAELVRRADALADVVVVTAHFGAEGTAAAVTPVGGEVHMGEPRGDARGFSRAVVDAGADLVLGAGPHVLRGIESYKGRLIAHSLGNFAGVENFSTAGDLALSGFLSVRLRRNGSWRAGWLHSHRLDAGGRPTPDPTNAAAAFVATRTAEDFPETGVRIQPSGRLLPRPRAGDQGGS